LAKTCAAPVDSPHLYRHPCVVAYFTNKCRHERERKRERMRKRERERGHKKKKSLRDRGEKRTRE